MTRLQRFNTSVEALATIGAELRLRCDDLGGDSHSRSLIQDVIQKIEPGILEGLDENQERAALALIQTSLRQAIDLLENPARAPGWTNEDPILLQSQGQLSRQIVRSIGKIAMDRPDIDFALRQSGSFLDVGTGVGWLAIEAARTWPALRVVGIDLWEPAPRLARKNLTGSGVGDRVELRLQSVEQLDDEAVFSLAWFPRPFIARETAARALERVRRALAPGGWLVFGFYTPAPSELDEALNCLRAVRSGGHQWTAIEAMDQLRSLDFGLVETVSPSPALLFVLGQRAKAAT
jgi:SAM-dependent methyltransferase